MPILLALTILTSLVGLYYYLHAEVAKLMVVEAVTLTRQCTGSCTSYTVTLRPDGSVKFIGNANGIQNVEQISTIDISAFKRVTDALKEIGFTSLTTNFSEPAKHNIDGLCPKKENLPSLLTITLETGANKFVVKHDMGCSVLPIHSQFTKLANIIDQAANTDQWTRN